MIIQPNDIIIVTKGTSFRAGIVKKNESRTIYASSSMAILRCKDQKYHSEVLLGWLMSEDGLYQLQNIAVGSAIQSIGLKALKNLEIPLSEKQLMRSDYGVLMQHYLKTQDLSHKVISKREEIMKGYTSTFLHAEEEL